MKQYQVKNNLMRPDLARVKLLRSFGHAIQLIVVLLTALTIYGWMTSRDAATEAKDTAAQAELKLAHCLNGGTFKVNELGALKCGVPFHEEASRYRKD